MLTVHKSIAVGGAVLITLLSEGAAAQRIHTHGLFLGAGGMLMTLESDALRPPDEGQMGVAGRLGYGFGDYLALVISGDLASTDLTYDSAESEFEFAHIGIGARLHPFRAWRRIGPYVEGSWLRYAATTDRVIAPATTVSRITLEGTGAAAAAGTHIFLSRAFSLEMSAEWSDGKLTKVSRSDAGSAFTPVNLQSRLYRVGLTWWLGT